jgi:peptide/nickel transport system permease protein
MIRYLLRRLLQSIILLFVVSVVIFAIVHSAPGGPAILLNPELDPALAEEFREQLGLDDPLPVQYGRWLGNVFQLNFGISFQHSIPVTTLIKQRFPASLLLAGTAMLIATTVALVLGTVSALRRYSIYDYGATLFAFLGLSIPGFWLGIMLIIIFAVQLGWLPSGGMKSSDGGDLIDRLRHLILPAISLSSFAVAQLMRYTRSSMIEVLKNDYIRTARSKGLAEQVVIYRHAMKNALIPVITVIGVITPRLLGGAVITETVFTWPGMGRLAVDAARTRDFPLVMAITLFVAALVILSNLIADVCYGFLDPRIKFE